MITNFTIADSAITLRRYPLQKNETLQAWDASDEYVIEYISQLNIEAGKHLGIFNDNFGALTCWANHNQYRTVSINDSVVAKTSIIKNLEENNIERCELINSLDAFPNEAFDYIIIKLPKSHRLLAWQLQQIAVYAKHGTQIIACGKVKDIHTSTLKLFEKYLGETTTSLAKKKSRLIFCTKQKSIETLPPATTSFEVNEYQIKLENHPNVFSAERLDIAAYLMLENIPKSEKKTHIIDLGCGNGVLAIQAAKNNPNAHISLTDESYMAIASAKINIENNAPKSATFSFHVDDCLTTFSGKADLILCNPPFHQASAITDHIAWQMFNDAKRNLKVNGKILVIGNRHLGYHMKLKRLFSNSRTVASNAKFVIIEAINTPKHTN